MKLTSISEHSDWLESILLPEYRKYQLHRKRVEFGKQTLNISFFVPAKFVDGEWVVLEKPIETIGGVEMYTKEYETAKSNVLFEVESFTKNKIKSTSWFEYRFTFKDGKWFDFEEDTIYTIEDLVKYEPTLTTTAKKQIGL